VFTAVSGAEALDFLSNGSHIDLVLLDFSMGAMNVDELAIKLRERYPGLRLIAVSAVEDLPPALLRAVNGRVRKGQSPEILLAKISEVMGRSGDQIESEAPGVASASTILCVDDEELQLQMRAALFESAGFEALQARSASTALEIFRTRHIDAVVMDYWLSGTNGTKVAEEMKRLHPRIPIVMLSGFSSLPGEGSVVDAWLRKAEVEPEALVNEVRRLIGFQSDLQQTSLS
jgi:CheY-like chemotaxis protein